MGLRPWLWLSPSLAHRLSTPAINGISWITPSKPTEWGSLDWRGLHFPNRVGVAGGVDKDAANVRAWWRLGAGFIEVGTITPRPQPGNTPPVVDRDLAQLAIWNRMGFPSKGVKKVAERIERIKQRATPIFANIGKNAATPLENASQDYIELLKALHEVVDGFVINISSPNTKGLRELLKPQNLKGFLAPIVEARPRGSQPMLLKLSPDMEGDELASALEVSHALGIDGWIVTNTSQSIREHLRFPKEGGVSGAPLAARSKEVLRQTLDVLGNRRAGKLIISVGGILHPGDVRERLEMGADLVQVYSALIFEGPMFFRKVAKWQRAQQA